jgi:hypothetical protein
MLRWATLRWTRLRWATLRWGISTNSQCISNTLHRGPMEVEPPTLVRAYLHFPLDAVVL